MVKAKQFKPILLMIAGIHLFNCSGINYKKMSKTIKLSKEELEILKGYQQQQNSITFELGQVDINRAILEGQRASVLDKLGDLQEKTNKTAKELQEKYGDGNIDLESGEFTTTE